MIDNTNDTLYHPNGATRLVVKLRKRLARRLVLLVSGWWSTSYDIYVREDQVDGEVDNQHPWATRSTVLIKAIEEPALRLARKLDWKAAVDQMANEGWWG